MDRKKKLSLIFVNTLRISASTFGGGFVIVPLLRLVFSDKLKWVEKDEIMELVTIAQSAPGPIAVNSSVIIGYRIAGITGALSALIGTILPPFFIITIITATSSHFLSISFVQNFMEGMQIGICAVILTVIIDMCKSILKDGNRLSLFFGLASVIALVVFRANVVWIMLACIAVYFMQYIVIEKEKRQ
ncbi:MAG: chromate transporter [Tissierellia bacterium]|nr:chromate transporter [Tissierellia bacterium]